MYKNIPLFVYTIFCLSIHLLMGNWVASAFAPGNNAAMNIGVQISVLSPCPQFFWVCT